MTWLLMQYVINYFRTIRTSVLSINSMQKESSSAPLDKVWLSEPEPWNRKGKMQACCNHHDEWQHIWVWNMLSPMPTYSHTQCAGISDDNWSDHSSYNFELSQLEGRIWPDHANVVADGDFWSLSITQCHWSRERSTWTWPFLLTSMNYLVVIGA